MLVRQLCNTYLTVIYAHNLVKNSHVSERLPAHEDPTKPSSVTNTNSHTVVYVLTHMYLYGIGCSATSQSSLKQEVVDIYLHCVLPLM